MATGRKKKILDEIDAMYDDEKPKLMDLINFMGMNRRYNPPVAKPREMKPEEILANQYPFGR